VDFFWINRDQRSFEWFVNLLSQLEIEQAELGVTMERFLEMHMYITSALQKSDMKAVGLQLALDLLHERVRSRRFCQRLLLKTLCMTGQGDSLDLRAFAAFQKWRRLSGRVAVPVAPRNLFALSIT
jgi:hypothetical protein